MESSSLRGCRAKIEGSPSEYCSFSEGVYAPAQCGEVLSRDGVYCGTAQDICAVECSSTQIWCNAATLKCENVTQSQETSPRSVAILVTFPIAVLLLFLLLTLAVCFLDIRRIHNDRRRRLYAPQDSGTE